VYRLREMNANSEAIKRQRRNHQDDYADDQARVGRTLHHSDVFSRLKKLIPAGLYITEGNVMGPQGPDWSVFRTYPGPQPHLEGRDFEYLFYVPFGVMPEYSQHEFNAQNVLVREKQRGWRTPLLRLIKKGMLTEEQCDQEFGAALGPA